MGWSEDGVGGGLIGDGVELKWSWRGDGVWLEWGWSEAGVGME